jgi:DNA-binding LacI/PurR family transcriptional regulator
MSRTRLTSHDIADAAGVSQTTVSLVLRGAAAGRVSARTQEHVRRVARELGYQPHAPARSLRSGHAHMLGLVVPDVTDPFFGAVVRGAQSVADEDGYAVAMIEAASSARLDGAVAAIRAGALDRLIVCSPTSAELRRARAVRERLAVLDGGAPRDVPHVRFDLADGVRRVVAHLRELGHTRLAHLTGAKDSPTFLERRRALARHAPDAVVAVARIPFDWEAGRAAAAEFLAGAPDVTALVCDTDRVAMSAIWAARERGLSVPADLSVTGFNDTDLAQGLDLTSVALPAVEAGRQAARMALAPREPPARVLLPVELHVRGSTRSAPAGRRSARR